MPIDLSILRLPQQQPAPSFLESQLRANQLMASQAQMAQNAMQLQKLASEREQENALTAAYQTPGVVGPDGRINYNALTTALQGGKAASQIPKVSELRFNAEKSAAELEKTQAQTRQERLKNINSKLGMFGEMQIRANTPEELLGVHNAVHADEDLSPFLRSLNVDPEKGRQEILSLDTPEKLQAFKSKSQLALKDVRQRFDDAEAIQSAEQEAANAAVQGTVSGPAGPGRAPAVTVTADPRKQAILTAEILASRGRQELAKNYLEQATKAAELSVAGQTPEIQEYKFSLRDPGFLEYKTKLKRAGAPNQTVSVGGKVYQQEAAKETMDIIRNAPKALQALEKTNTVMDLLEKNKANTGFAAQFRTDIDRAIKLFSKANRSPESITDTELLQSLLGSDVFPLIHSLGIGARGLDTERERIFLQKVMTGAIELDNTTLKEMTRMRAETYEQAIDEYNSRLDSGEFDDYMSETKRKLKPIKKPTRGKGTAAGGAGSSIQDKADAIIRGSK